MTCLERQALDLTTNVKASHLDCPFIGSAKRKRIFKRNNFDISFSIFTLLNLRCPFKNRSAMRTCVACEIELLFSGLCLFEFLLKEQISDYG